MCDGGLYDAAAYPALYAITGAKYNIGGEAVGKFRVPDLRGRVIAGADNMGGSAAGRLQVTTTLTTTSGSTSATVASNIGMTTGMQIISEHVPAGATVIGVAGNTITMSAAATGTASGVAVRFSLFDDAQVLGSAAGGQSHTLTEGQMPQHSHVLPASGDTILATGTSMADAGRGTDNYNGSNVSDSAGGSQAHPNVQPTLILNYIIKT